ncbi:ribbon-helix-helix domain-containing protein [Brevundimonas naejangsanensis]|uniref:ribbon-helix-helix domain-containing protein n=1 Tax=Brevundimonas naejangsanensis TaxID=588932 RepID=UPI003208ECB4
MSGLIKRSVLLSGHATSVALEPEFWTVLDAIGTELSLSRASLMIRIDAWRGRRPLASSCRVLALQWAGGDRSFAKEKTS